MGAEHVGNQMTGVLIVLDRVASFLRRFLSEVVASVVTTACVAAATTAYLNYESTPARKPPEIKALLSPTVDLGAGRFVRTAEDPPPPAAAAERPAERPRPRAVAKPVERPPTAAAKLATLHSGTKPGDEVVASPLPPPVEVATFDPPPDAAIFEHPEAEPPAPPPAQPVEPRSPEEQKSMLGVHIPVALPTGGEVVERVKGWGAAVGRLLP